MKKSLLFAACAAVALSAAAENQVYWFNYEDPTIGTQPYMGMVTSVSPNGEYAIVLDDEMLECFLWKKSDPTKLELLNWKQLNSAQQEINTPLEIYGISDAGTIVGSYRPFGTEKFQPFYKEMNGERVDLPIPSWSTNLNYPIAINAEGNIIGGYVSGPGDSKTLVNTDGTPQKFSMYWPIIWGKGADGEFEYHVNYDSNIMGDHQGFYPNSMYTDGTVDGTFLGGYYFVGAGSSLAAIYNKGQIEKWNETEIVSVPWYYRGKFMGYEKYESIDGKRDGYGTSDYINAGITCCDTEGNFFGTLFHVGDFDYDPDNLEDETYGKTVNDTYTWGSFNIHTGEWTETDGHTSVSCALNKDTFFSGHQIYTNGIDGGSENIASKFNLDFQGKSWGGVSKASLNGNVLGMNYTTTDGTGKQSIHPIMVVLDKDIVGLDNLEIDADAKVLIMVYNGNIEVNGAQEVAVYDLNGVKVSDKAVSNVGAGTYVVVADGKSHKILVK